MSREYSQQECNNLELIRRVYQHVLNPLDSSQVDHYMSRDYIQHSPLAKSGTDGLKEFLDWAKNVSPKAEHHVKRMFVDGDYVIAHVHVIIEPGTPGKNVIDIFRIEAGKVAEHWDAAQSINLTSANDNGVF